MATWIPATNAHADMPAETVSVLGSLDHVDDLAHVRDSNGGIRRLDVVATLEPRWKRAGVVVAGQFFDGVSADGVAIRVEAGRAHTNNAGVVATLEAAKAPGVSSLVLVVPNHYKGSAQAEPMTRMLRRFLGVAGIELQLQGVAVLAY